MRDQMEYVETYSWSAFLARATTTPSNTSARESGDYRNLQWDLGAGFDGSLKLATEGWHEGVKMVQDKVFEVYRHVATKIEQVNWNYDVEPAQLDVARYLEGEPECWLTPDRQYIAGQGKLISMAYGGAVSAGIDSGEIVRRGVVVCALIDALAKAGHSVKLDVFFSIGRGGQRYSEVIVNVKDYGEPLNIGRVVFSICHPGMFRRLVFGVEDQWPAEHHRNFGIGYSYGSPPFDRSSLAPDIDFGGLALWDEGSGVEIIVRELEKQGVRVKS